MMSIYTARETYVGQAPASEPVTARTPAAWATGSGDQAQSATFRALAWSQDDDSAAEPLPYTGADYSGPSLSVSTDSEEPQSATRLRRSTLLCGIAAGFAAAAIGGLLLTVMNTQDTPDTTSVRVTQPVLSAAIPQSKAEAPAQVRQIRSSAPTQANGPIPSARSVPPAVSPQAPAAAPVPESQTPVAPVVAAPEAAEAAAPEAAVAAAPETAVASASADPEFTPPGTLPPVLTPPSVSLPEVTPQLVPHPVVPPTFHIPTTPQGGGTLPPVNSVGASGAAGGVTLNPVVTLPPMIPTLSAGGAH